MTERLTVKKHSQKLPGIVVSQLRLRPRMDTRKFTDEQFLRLHRQGYLDSQIAEKLGVSLTPVGERRRKLGLKANKSKFSKNVLSVEPLRWGNDRKKR